MKKIVKILLAVGGTLATGVVVSRGRDFWGSRKNRVADAYDGAGILGDDPAYQMAYNPQGDLIFSDPSSALRRFREEYRGHWEPLKTAYSLPELRMDTCALYWAYQQYGAGEGVLADPFLAAFLQTFLNGIPKT